MTLQLIDIWNTHPNELDHYLHQTNNYSILTEIEKYLTISLYYANNNLIPPEDILIVHRDDYNIAFTNTEHLPYNERYFAGLVYLGIIDRRCTHNIIENNCLIDPISLEPITHSENLYVLNHCGYNIYSLSAYFLLGRRNDPITREPISDDIISEVIERTSLHNSMIPVSVNNRGAVILSLSSLYLRRRGLINYATLRLYDFSSVTILFLDLSGNTIENISGIWFPPQCLTLNLSNNFISHLNNVTFPETCEEINLSYNTISSLSGMTFPDHCLRILLRHNYIISMVPFPARTEIIDLGENCISQIPYQYTFPFAIHTIFLDYNLLTGLRNFSLPSLLEIIDFSCNNIFEIENINVPESCISFWLFDNSISDDNFFITSLISRGIKVTLN